MTNVSEDPQSADPAATVDYVRRVYERAIYWYKVAEAKAQLLLTVSGLLITLIFGMISGNLAEVSEFSKVAGVETWALLFIATSAILGAVICAAASLWSKHGTTVKVTFPALGVDPGDPKTYKPEVLWYFGHLALLEPKTAASMISHADRSFEIKALSYNVVHLAGVVLYKHRLINAGWAMGALALVSIVATAASAFIRAQ
jgi:hypothetical protein